MPYTEPNYNMNVTVWRHPDTPQLTPDPGEEMVMQVYVESRQGGLASWDDGPSETQPPTIILRTGPDPDVMGDNQWIFGIPYDGSTWYFKAYFKMYMHWGFPNMYAAIFVQQCDDAGDPIRAGCPWIVD